MSTELRSFPRILQVLPIADFTQPTRKRVALSKPSAADVFLYAPWSKKGGAEVEKNAEAMNDHLQWRVGKNCQIRIIIENPLLVPLTITKIELLVSCPRSSLIIDENQTVKIAPKARQEVQVNLLPTAFAAGQLALTGLTLTLWSLIKTTCQVDARGFPVWPLKP